MRKNNIIFRILCLCLIWGGFGAVYSTAEGATSGLFSVSLTKKVRFADTNVTGLKQWSYANDWREDQKNEEGHDGWYVLDHAEWTYMLITRDGEGLSKNALGTVVGDSGLIILPDDWVQPAGVPVYKPVKEGYDFRNNIYTASEWALMAQSGAVFLPCKGYSTDGETVTDPTRHGRYWASDEYESNTANGYNISFDFNIIHDQNNYLKTHYYSVRLVKEEASVTELDETHESDDYEDDWTAAKTKDFAIVNRTFAKDSTLYTLCLPFDVPNVDASPLAGAEIFEFKGGRVGGTTGNEQLFLNLSRLSGKRLTQGVPYVLRWAKTSPVQEINRLCFYNIENWDDNTTAATDPGNETIKFHGVYPKTHIPGYETAEEAHYNFFIGANDSLYWPDDTNYTGHMMKGFRAYFYIMPGKGPSSISQYRHMPVVWQINEEEDCATGIPNTTYTERVEKIFRNGQVVLIIDGTMYDLQGKKVCDR